MTDWTGKIKFSCNPAMTLWAHLLATRCTSNFGNQKQIKNDKSYIKHLTTRRKKLNFEMYNLFHKRQSYPFQIMSSWNTAPMRWKNLGKTKNNSCEKKKTLWTTVLPSKKECCAPKCTRCLKKSLYKIQLLHARGKKRLGLNRLWLCKCTAMTSKSYYYCRVSHQHTVP